MKKNITAFSILISIIFFITNSCKSYKETRNKEKLALMCLDTSKYLISNKENLKPQILLNPNLHLYPVKLGNEDYWQIEFTRVGYFRSYRIYLDEIVYEFHVGTNNCRSEGDIQKCFIDKNKLIEDCTKKYSSIQGKGQDCVTRLWNIKVQGFNKSDFCGSQDGPISSEVKISLQCGNQSGL